MVDVEERHLQATTQLVVGDGGGDEEREEREERRYKKERKLGEGTYAVIYQGIPYFAF